MKAKSIIYSRLISKGNYENAKIEIELEVEKGEKASDVYEAAKAFVEKRIAIEKMSDYTIERAKKVMDDKRNHTLVQIFSRYSDFVHFPSNCISRYGTRYLADNDPDDLPF